MKKILVALVLGTALGASAADANIAWQFTGATERVASAESESVVTDYVRPLPLCLSIAYFDTLMPNDVQLDGCDLDTMPPGLLLLIR